MPSMLADPLFCGGSFLPEPVFDRHLDRVNQTKAVTPFANIRPSPSTIEGGKYTSAPAGYQRTQPSAARFLREVANAREAKDKRSHGQGPASQAGSRFSSEKQLAVRFQIGPASALLWDFRAGPCHTPPPLRGTDPSHAKDQHL